MLSKVTLVSAAVRIVFLTPLFVLAGCGATHPSVLPFDPPEQTIGERFFLETRFAEYFAEHMTDVNTPRNAMQMVGSLAPHVGLTFLHFDGEFAGPADLGRTTPTGRN